MHRSSATLFDVEGWWPAALGCWTLGWVWYGWLGGLHGGVVEKVVGLGVNCFDVGVPFGELMVMGVEILLRVTVDNAARDVV